MKVAVLIDWISVTYKHDRLPKSMQQDGSFEQMAVCAAHIGMHGASPVRTKPMFGYSAAIKMTNGQIFMSSERHSEMGVHGIMPGSTLTPDRAMKCLDLARKYQGRVTRLDVAVDIQEGTLTPDDCYLMHKAHRYEGRKRKAKLMTGDDGATLYIGSRTSEAYMRVYDKAAETGTTGHWLRIELELKGQMANNVAKYINQEGSLTVIGKIMNEFIRFDNTEWQQAIDGKPGAVLRSERKTSDTRKWLLGVVAQSLARETYNDKEFFNAFFSAVQEYEQSLDTGTDKR